MQEIERKFLVTSEAFKKQAFKTTTISQGFLNSNKLRAVRIRLTDTQGFITIKGESSSSGLSRYEWEKEIPINDAKDLLKLCETGMISKTRYYVNVGQHVFEVDEFYGQNEGLVVAEIELSSENESFLSPDWLGKEVTGEIKYYNAMLIRKPYRKW